LIPSRLSTCDNPRPALIILALIGVPLARVTIGRAW
jgi:hypothetical protein